MAPVKKKKENVRNLRYPESAMRSAIKAVRDGRFKLREAGRHYGVPHSTLSNKLKGLVPEERKMGRATYLTDKEESLLVAYVVANAKKGIPLKRRTLLETVQKIIDDDGRKTPFKGNRPGRKWFDLFKNRHPQLCEKKAEGISTARANVSENDLRQWSEFLKQYLKDEEALDILDDPKRIYNADESGFQTCPVSRRVLGPVGMKNFYEVKSGKEKEQLTVMACINAAGQIVSPMIVYPLTRISKDIACNVPTNWSIGRSPKGWMTGALYYEYIASVFNQWLKTEKIKKPVLLLVDGHRSHMTLQVSEFCAENDILTHALYPNSTHITQPADVSLFKCLKSGWQNTVFDYKKNTGNKQITRAGFAPLLSKAFQDNVTPEIIANGFKRCGIYPFDPSAVDYSKCMDNEVRRVLPSTVEVGVDSVLLLESFMRRGRAQQFRSVENEEWQGDESAKELFYVWKKFRHHCFSQECGTEDMMPKQVDRNATPVQNYQEEGDIEDTMQERVEKNATPGLNKQEGSSSFGQDGMPQSPSIMKTPTRGSSTDSTRCSAVTSPEISYPDLNSPFFVTRTRQTSPDNVMENETCETEACFSSSLGDIPPTSSIIEVSLQVTATKHILSNTTSEINPDPNAQSSTTSNRNDCSPINSSPSLGTTNRRKITPNIKLIHIMAQKQKQLSPAFGNHILFPSDSPIKKSTKERLPLAITSTAFREYFQIKDTEKKKKIEEIEERKRKREEKRNKTIQKELTAKSSKQKKSRTHPCANKTKYKRQILRSDSETENDENEEVVLREEIEETSDSENVPLSRLSTKTKPVSKGDYVIVKYEGEYFPGVVTNVDQGNYEISTMTFSTGNTFRWPEKADKIWYPEKDVIESIEEPVLTNKRGFYSVKEMKKFLTFTV